MANISFTSKELVAEAVVEHITRSYEDAHIQTFYINGYAPPDKIMPYGKEAQGYTPDIVHRSEEGVELYEIELDKKVKIDKWKLFSRYAQKEKSTFSIVTHEQNLDHFRALLKSNHISAKLIYF